MKKVTISNTSSTDQTYKIDASFSAADAAAADAITIVTPGSVVVGAGQQVTAQIVFAVNGDRLPAWPFYDRTQDLALAGASGNTSAVLNNAEVDGTLIVRDATGAAVATLGWQALPKRAASTVARDLSVTAGPDGTAPLAFRNLGVEDGVVDAFTLTGSSGRLPAPTAGQPGSPGSNEAVIDLANVGVRDAGDALQFAVTAYSRRPTPIVPGLIQIEVDTDGDGTFDHVAYNDDFSSFNPVDGRTMVWAGPRGTPTRYGPVDADVDSANQVFTVPLAALGLKAGQTFSFRVLAFDRYFTGHLEDSITGMSYTVGSPRYTVADGSTFIVPGKAPSAVATVRSQTDAGPSSATGLLLLYRVNGGTESSTVAVNG
jgi:hypothetical protein